MVTAPEDKIKAFAPCPGDIVSVHFESTADPAKALLAVKDTGATPFLAINPLTPVAAVLPFIDLIGGVLLMTVTPGFAGQPMAPGSLEKISALRALLDENGRPDAHIEVDGCVSYVNAPRMRAAGADRFVAGTSSVFGPGNLTENVAKLRALLAAAEQKEAI